MTAYPHKIKPIPARKDVPTGAAPSALGQVRRVVWADVLGDVRTVGFVHVPGSDRNVMFHATRLSWPAAGGRAIVLTGLSYSVTDGLEIWTPEQLVTEITAHVGASVAARVAGKVWANPLRAAPGPWPAHARLLEFK